MACGFWLDLPQTVAILEAGSAVAEGADSYLDAWAQQYSDYLGFMAQVEADYADALV